MMAVLFGLATGIAFGSHDFFGGVAARRASPLAVVALFNVVALLAFVLIAPLIGGAPTLAGVVWGAVAGAAIGTSNIIYFRALAKGRMGVVATVTATWAAIVPLVAGVATGERPGIIAWAGITAVVASVWLLTYTPRTPTSASSEPSGSTPVAGAAREGVLDATVAGIGFGFFFVALSQASSASETFIWPLLGATSVAALLVGVTALLRRANLTTGLSQWPAIVIAGVLYALGNWAFFVGVSQGWVSIVAVLAALSPLPTVVLARLVLCESLTRWQMTGIAVALAGVTLITLGVSAQS